MNAVKKKSVFLRFIRPLVWCALGSIGLAVFAGCVQVMYETDLGYRILTTALTLVLLFTLFIGGFVVSAQRASGPIVMLPACLLVFFGELCLLQLIWLEDILSHNQEETLARVAAGSLIGAGTIIHSGVFAILPKTGPILRVGKWLTVGALWFNSGFVIAVLSAPDFFEDVLFEGSAELLGWTFLAVQMFSVFTAASGTVVVPLLSVLAARKQYRSEWLQKGVVIAMACPCCDHRQTVRRGSNRCANCHAPIRIELREPRCECGYLLFELKGEACPECGRVVNSGPESQGDRVNAPPLAPGSAGGE